MSKKFAIYDLKRVHFKVSSKQNEYLHKVYEYIGTYILYLGYQYGNECCHKMDFFFIKHVFVHRQRKRMRNIIEK